MRIGVILIVAVTLLVPLFMAVNEGIFPVPLAANPILDVELVQLKVAPLGTLIKLLAATMLPPQID